MSDWVLFDGNVWVYRASQVGGCIRSLTAARLGESATPPGEFIRKAMDESASKEDEALTEYTMRTGHSVIWQQKRCVLPVLGLPVESQFPAIIRGHIDGLDQTDDTVLDVKWLSARNFDLYNRGGVEALGSLGLKYIWQAAAYGHALERKFRFVIGNKGHDPNSDEEWLIIEPAVTAESLVPLEQVMERVVMVEEFAERDELPECDRKCSTNEAFAHVHFFESESGYKADEELAQLIQEAWELRVQLEGDPDDPDDDGLKGRYEAVKDRIKDSYAPGVHVAGEYSAQVVHAKGALRLDGRAVKKRYPEIWDECAVMGADQRRVTIKRQRAKGDGSGN